MKIQKGDRFGRLTVLRNPKTAVVQKTQRLGNGRLAAYMISMTEVKCDCGKKYLIYTNNLKKTNECSKCARAGHRRIIMDSWAKSPKRLRMRIEARKREIEDVEERIYQWTIKAERLENEKAGFEKILESLNG